jgi:hypothetical protein
MLSVHVGWFYILVFPFIVVLDLDPVHPLDVIMDAWNRTSSEGVVGSSTICVATLDKKLGQLSYSNVGDCGLLVVGCISN